MEPAHRNAKVRIAGFGGGKINGALSTPRESYGDFATRTRRKRRKARRNPAATACYHPAIALVLFAHICSNGGNHAVVYVCRLLLRGRFSGERRAALYERRVRAPVPESLRFAARQRSVFANGQRALGYVQCGNRVSAGVPRGRVPPASNSQRRRAGSRGPVDGNPVGRMVWKGSRPRIGPRIREGWPSEDARLACRGARLFRLRGAFRFQLALVFF